LKAERQAADIGYFQEAALSEVINPCSLIWFEVLLAPLADICVPLGGLQTAKASFPQSQLFVRGREIPWPRSVAAALSYGIALTPEDRKSQGIILRLSGAENVALADLGSVSTHGILSDRRLRREAAESMSALAFDTARLGDPAGNLSGGNQQKLVIGKWLHRKPRILLLDEPTHGIDVGAKAEIYKLVSELANHGMAVILVSSEFEEIVNICDRVLVLGGGRSLGVLERQQLSIKAIFDRLFHSDIAA
jgi:rhamnose transport system ATP-binding protein